MKNLIIVAALAISISGFSQNSKALVKKEKVTTETRMNQQKLSPEERDQKQLERLSSKLGLTDVQQKQVSTILFEQTASREKAKLDRKMAYEKKIKMSQDEKAAWKKSQMDSHNSMKSKISAVLTPDQKAKWEEMQERREGKRSEMIEKRSEIKSRN